MRIGRTLRGDERRACPPGIDRRLDPKLRVCNICGYGTLAAAPRTACRAPRGLRVLRPRTRSPGRSGPIPTSLTIGFQRAVVVEELDPNLIAAVDQTNAVRYRPRTRYDRTLRYFAMVAFGDFAVDVEGRRRPREGALQGGRDRAARRQRLRRERPAVAALDPDDRRGTRSSTPTRSTARASCPSRRRTATGRSARSPPSCRRSSPRTSRARARLSVSTSRHGVRRLAGSEAAQSMMDHLLNAEVMLPPVPRWLRPVTWTVNKALRYATIATMPQWMRKMAGLRQPRDRRRADHAGDEGELPPRCAEPADPTARSVAAVAVDGPDRRADPAAASRRATRRR